MILKGLPEHETSQLSLMLALFAECVGLCAMSLFGDFRQRGYPLFFVLSSIPAFAGYVAACRRLNQDKDIPFGVGLAFSVLFRLILLSMYPGDDIWRYLWEGRIQNFGFNPYLIAPNDVELESLRTSYWSLINHPVHPAIYPPLAELVFKSLPWVWGKPVFFKCVFVLADLGTVYVLQHLLKTLNLPSRRLWWYAWNPLVIYCFSGGGHFDSLMILCLLLAISFLIRKKDGWAILFLGAAIYLKWIAIVALPFFVVKMRRRFLIAALLLPIPLFYAIYGNFIPQLCESRNFWHTAFSHGSLALLFPPESNMLLLWIFVVGMTLLLWRYYKNPLTGICHAFLWLVLVSPVVHPWYVTWVLPLACLVRLKAAWVLSGTIFFYFLSWNGAGRVDLSHGKGLETLAIYIPFYLFLAFELWNQRSQKMVIHTTPRVL